MRMSKNRKTVLENVDLTKTYTLDEASTIVKENSKVKFDATVDLPTPPFPDATARIYFI